MEYQSFPYLMRQHTNIWQALHTAPDPELGSSRRRRAQSGGRDNLKLICLADLSDSQGGIVRFWPGVDTLDNAFRGNTYKFPVSRGGTVSLLSHIDKVGRLIIICLKSRIHRWCRNVKKVVSALHSRRFSLAGLPVCTHGRQTWVMGRQMWVSSFTRREECSRREPTLERFTTLRTALRQGVNRGTPFATVSAIGRPEYILRKERKQSYVTCSVGCCGPHACACRCAG